MSELRLLPRALLIGMSVAFGICVLGLAAGMCYSLFEYFFRRRELWAVLNLSVWFYKMLGAMGITGFALFLAFIVSQASGKRR